MGSSENKEKDGKMKTKKTDKSSEKSKNAIQNMFAKIVKKTTASEVTKEPEIIEIDIDEDNTSREEEENTIKKSDSPIRNIEDQATVSTPTRKRTPKKVKTPSQKKSPQKKETPLKGTNKKTPTKDVKTPLATKTTPGNGTMKEKDNTKLKISAKNSGKEKNLNSFLHSLYC